MVRYTIKGTRQQSMNCNYSNRVVHILVLDERTGDAGNELLDDFLFNAGLVLIGFTTGVQQ